jgi:hypothetical protein
MKKTSAVVLVELGALFAVVGGSNQRQTFRQYLMLEL